MIAKQADNTKTRTHNNPLDTKLKHMQWYKEKKTKRKCIIQNQTHTNTDENTQDTYTHIVLHTRKDTHNRACPCNYSWLIPCANQKIPEK